MTFEVSISNARNLDKKLEKAIRLASLRALERVRMLIKEHAMIMNHMQPVGSLQGYHWNKRMPVFSGELLDSMTEVMAEQGKFYFYFRAPYADAIEHGTVTDVGTLKGNPKWEAWKKIRGKGHRFRKGTIIGRAHPFIQPRFDEVMQHEYTAILAHAIEDVDAVEEIMG